MFGKTAAPMISSQLQPTYTGRILIIYVHVVFDGWYVMYDNHTYLCMIVLTIVLLDLRYCFMNNIFYDLTFCF